MDLRYSGLIGLVILLKFSSYHNSFNKFNKILRAKLSISHLSFPVLFYFSLILVNQLSNNGPISNAEKCRRYRERHREEYRKALRKMNKIVTMKVKNTKENELRLKLQRDKREYRQRINQRKENQTPSSSAESSFYNKSVTCRSLKKAVDALPKSPNKRKEIVQSLSQKFNLRIMLTNKKQGRPENELSPDEIEWLIEFMDRPDITYTNPGKKD